MATAAAAHDAVTGDGASPVGGTAPGPAGAGEAASALAGTVAEPVTYESAGTCATRAAAELAYLVAVGLPVGAVLWGAIVGFAELGRLAEQWDATWPHGPWRQASTDDAHPSAVTLRLALMAYFCVAGPIFLGITSWVGQGWKQRGIMVFNRTLMAAVTAVPLYFSASNRIALAYPVLTYTVFFFTAGSLTLWAGLPLKVRIRRSLEITFNVYAFFFMHYLFYYIAVGTENTAVFSMLAGFGFPLLKMWLIQFYLRTLMASYAWSPDDLRPNGGGALLFAFSTAYETTFGASSKLQIVTARSDAGFLASVLTNSLSELGMRVAFLYVTRCLKEAILEEKQQLAAAQEPPETFAASKLAVISDNPLGTPDIPDAASRTGQGGLRAEATITQSTSPEKKIDSNVQPSVLQSRPLEKMPLQKISSAAKLISAVAELPTKHARNLHEIMRPVVLRMFANPIYRRIRFMCLTAFSTMMAEYISYVVVGALIYAYGLAPTGSLAWPYRLAFYVAVEVAMDYLCLIPERYQGLTLSRVVRFSWLGHVLVTFYTLGGVTVFVAVYLRLF